MAMIGDRGFRPAPHAVFVTATVLFVFALLAAALCASRLPWTGLILDLAESEGAPRLLEPPAGSPAEGRVEAGRRLLGLRDADGVALDSQPLVAALTTTAWSASYREYDARIGTLDRFHQHLASGHAVVILDNGEEIGIDVAKRRGIGSLSEQFWTRALCAAVAYLTAIGLWAFRPGTAVTRYFAASGVTLTAAVLLSAIAASRQLGFPGELLRLLDQATTLFSLGFAACAVGIVSHYPTPLPGVRYTLPLTVVLLACGGGAHLLRLSETPAASLWPIFGIALVYGLILFPWQWRRHADNQRVRRGLVWFFLVCVTAFGFYIGTYTLPTLLGLTPWLPQHYASLSVTALYLGAAFGVYRYSLFDLDPWVFNAWLWFVLGLLVLMADGALVYALDLDSPAGLAAALAAAAWIYFPLRQALMLRLSRRIQRRDFRRLVADTLSAGLDEESTDTADQRWLNLLKRSFAPLHLHALEIAPAAATVTAGGARLQLPALPEVPAYELIYADRGNRLFGPRDQRLAQLLVDLFEQAMTMRLAASRGAARERLRLARDLHDDVIPPILSFIYRSEGSAAATRARTLLRDLRQTIQALSLEDV